MGAFFLVNSKESYDSDRALKLFHEMGFSAPQLVEIGDISIYVYSKMAIQNKNIYTQNGHTIISVGTPIYKGMDYDNSLSSLLYDYINQILDYDQLSGQYTIIFCYAGKVDILRDPMGSKHNFTDSRYHVISSHFLPICECVEEDLHINKMAFYEKFLTGFIMPPNTMFNEVMQIDDSIEKQISNSNHCIRFIQSGQTIYKELQFPETQQKSLAEQSDELRSYFESIRNYSQNGVDIGLSGGYDSRLVLACLNQYTKEKIHLHSHSTENVHENDLKIAYQMADYVGTPCHTVATKQLSHCDNIDEVLWKSVMYFDGRSSYSIGGCGEVYTASYRRNSTEGTPFTLTGVGGELYRNIFDIGNKKIRFERFIRDRVFSRTFQKAVSDELYHNISNTIIDRAAARLKIDKSIKQSKAIAHRYYCEIMMPDGQGNALDAYNQVSCCNAPFLEPHVIQKGYGAIPYHRSGGEFEGQLINIIDPGLAALPSSYGYPIGRRPIRARLKESIRMYIPCDIWNRTAALIYQKQNKKDYSALKKDLYANSETIKNAFEYMETLFPEISFYHMLQTGEDIRRIQFMAMTLYYFKERVHIT